jgi:large subunit ribosomal protein L30
VPRTFVWHRTRGPHHTPKEETPTSGKVRIEQVRSGIGKPAVMRRTLEAMGLRHHQDAVVKQDSTSLRGQIKKVRHLVKVSLVEE